MHAPSSLPRRLAGVALLLALALLPAATPLFAQTLQTIRVGAGPDDQATPLLWAAKTGLYRKYGLDVQIVKLAGAAAVAAALAGGSLEVGKGSTLTIVTAIAKGVPFTIIGNLSYYSADRPDIGMLVLANSNIKTAADLVGKTVSSVSLQDLNMIATMAWLDAGGVDRSKVKFVELPQSAVLAGMEQGRIDASSTFEPYLSSYLATGKVRIIGYPHDSISKKYSNAVLFTTSKWADEHADAVHRFLLASEAASTYITAHESVSSELIAEFAGLDPATVGNIRHARRGIALNPASIQPVVDAAAKYDIIPKAFSVKDMICSCALPLK
jgi:NitT/TauT family transport system substrate-binding protein